MIKIAAAILLVEFFITVDLTVGRPFFCLILTLIEIGVFLKGLIFSGKIKIWALILICPIPICLFWGVTLQNRALKKAYELRDILSQQRSVKDAYIAFNNICDENVCGNHPFGIIFYAGESVSDSKLLVYKYFEKHQIVPLDKSKEDYESEVTD